MKLNYLSSVIVYSGKTFRNKLNKNHYCIGIYLVGLPVQLLLKMYITLLALDPIKRDDKFRFRLMSKDLNNHLRRQDLKVFQTNTG